MSNENIINAITRINPDAKVSVSGSDIDTCEIEWHDETTPISKDDIKVKMNELQDEYNSNKYQRDRKNEYPMIEDQLDDIYHNGIDGWKETIKAVKDKYPKE
jgi:hypothetical protein|tara:strand:+ start:330 stop:635 length:306 start_codon:yes stop_codon:yes gene_type:complete